MSNANDEELNGIYGQVSDRISWEDFLDRVNEKVALMGGLCDRTTAGMLVARELGAGEMTVKIRAITPDSGSVNFVGRVISISDIREFARSDGSTGRVANLRLGDETGTIKVVLWDEGTDLVKSGDLKVGQVLKVRGFSREGRAGTEVSIGRNCNIEEVNIDVTARVEPFKVSEIKKDMSDVNVVACVVDPGTVREFSRKDGSTGLVRSVLLGDESGKIRLTLWNDSAKMELSSGDSLEIVNGSTKERYGQVEISADNYTVVRKVDTPVKYEERTTPISDLGVGNICSVMGHVSGLGEVREFQRQNGSPGRVANIHISDDSGRVKVALWGDQVDLLQGVDLGYCAEIHDALVKNGWNEELELSCSWRSRITFTPPE